MEFYDANYTSYNYGLWILTAPPMIVGMPLTARRKYLYTRVLKLRIILTISRV